LRFAIEPADATILVDGAPITGSELVVAKDDATHELKITAPGHRRHIEELRFAESQRIVIQLKPKSPGSRPGKPGRPGKPDRIDSTSPYQ